MRVDTALSCTGTVTAAVSLMKTFQSVKYRTFRAGLFATLGLWGIVPGLHALILYGGAYQMRSAFILDVCMGLVYLVCPPHAPAMVSLSPSISMHLYLCQPMQDIWLLSG